jgi:amidohydrolase
MRGTLRTFEPGLRDLLVRRLREVADGTARTLGASCDLEFTPHYPPTVNDPAMADFVAEVAAEVVGRENVVRDLVMMGAEDMSYFLQRLPGCYLFLGAGNEARGLTHPHHSPHFDFEEEAMLLGCELFLRIQERYFERFPVPPQRS